MQQATMNIAQAAEVATSVSNTLRASLRVVPRLPSQVHASAVANGQLMSDDAQARILPKLDNIIESIPDYGEQMKEHGLALSSIEQLRERAIDRDEMRQKSIPFLHKLQRVASGVSPSVSANMLPNSYYRLPDFPPAPIPPRGLYLHGDVGCGKSLLMDILFKCAQPIFLTSNNNTARVHYHAFMSGVYKIIHRYDGMTDVEREKQGVYHPLDAVVGQQLGKHNNSVSALNGGGGLLCFDEFQINDVADARLMHGIFDRLMRAGTVVCFTANRAPADLNRSQLKDKDFQPFLDLIHDRCELIHVTSGIDYREKLLRSDNENNQTNNKEGLSKNSKYYLSENDESGLKDAWKRVANTDNWDDVSENILPVAHGRKLVLKRARPDGSAVQMTSAELIESAVGASDYRALCSFTKHIVLSDVLPVFSNDTRNYARRFITLIDVCYEAKVKIIMRMEAKTLEDMFANVDVSRGLADAMEGLQFESEVAKEGVGADNRELSQGGHLFSGEDEVFAFRRAISRLKEMQTDGFGKRGIFA